MADTTRGSFPKKICSDCGRRGCCFIHWGPMVPKGESGSFCWFCWGLRLTFNRAKPLGRTPPGENKELKKFCLKITTRNNSVYRLEKPNEEGLRRISCNSRVLGFGLCKILLLEIGDSFCVWEYNPENYSKGWSTSPVVEIEKI